MVNLTDVGDSNATGLICHTSYSNFYTGRGLDYLSSRWWYPGNRTVTSNPSSRAFTRTRRIMSISLHHRANAEEDPPVECIIVILETGTHKSYCRRFMWVCILLIKVR